MTFGRNPHRMVSAGTQAPADSHHRPQWRPGHAADLAPHPLPCLMIHAKNLITSHYLMDRHSSPSRGDLGVVSDTLVGDDGLPLDHVQFLEAHLALGGALAGGPAVGIALDERPAGIGGQPGVVADVLPDDDPHVGLAAGDGVDGVPAVLGRALDQHDAKLRSPVGQLALPAAGGGVRADHQRRAAITGLVQQPQSLDQRRGLAVAAPAAGDHPPPAQQPGGVPALHRGQLRPAGPLQGQKLLQVAGRAVQRLAHRVPVLDLRELGVGPCL